MDAFEKSLDLARDSAISVKRVGLLATIIFVLVFSSVWKNRADSWENAYVRSASAALGWLQLTAEQRANTEVSDENRVLAEEFISTFGIADANFLSWSLQKVRESQFEHAVYVSLPFFGISFHANDLGILAGLALVLLMLWLLQALIGLRANIGLCVRVAREADSERNIRLLGLAIQAALPLSMTADGRVEHSAFIVRTICVLVVLFQTGVLYLDVGSAPFALALSRSGTIASIFLASLFTVMSCILAVFCWNQTRGILRDLPVK